jgi:hypothetical protein
MRILTVRQPWAHAIIHLGKGVENRVRNIAGEYRGPVAIHAGLTFDPAGLTSRTLRDAWVAHGGDEGHGGWGNRHRGMIIGVVDLVDVHLCRSSNRGFMTPVCFDPITPVGSVCSPWAEFEPNAERWHLVLANPRPLAEPIPFKGALGLRRLDDSTVALIEGALS